MARLNYRPLFIGSLIIIAVCLLCLGCITVMFDDLSSSYIWPALAVSCLFLQAIFYGIGIGPVGFVLATQIFPHQLRSLGCSLAIASKWAFVFLDVKMYHPFVNYLGLGGVFLIHFGILVLGVVFSMACLPETRNKTYTELENLFKKRGLSTVDKDNISEQHL